MEGKDLSCAICKDFYRKPVLLPHCYHNFCLECVVKQFVKLSSVRGKNKQGSVCFSCQVCEQATLLDSEKVAKLQRNYCLQALVDVYLSSCGTGTEEEGKPTGVPRIESTQSLCPKHELSLTMFCMDCKVTLCHLCDRLDGHHLHQAVQLKEAANQMKVTIRAQGRPIVTLSHQLVTAASKHVTNQKLKALFNWDFFRKT